MSIADAAVSPVALERPAAEVKEPVRPKAPRPPKVDETRLTATYANFCRVTGTPEELLIDFGLNAQPPGMTAEPIGVTQRIVLNPFTAKRLLQALGASVARHEQVFGTLETDVLKRAVK